MSWHGFSIAPPPLSEQTYSALRRVLDHQRLSESTASALGVGQWIAVKCDNLVSGHRCNTYVCEVISYGSAQVVARCRRPSCKDRRTVLFLGALPEVE